MSERVAVRPTSARRSVRLVAGIAVVGLGATAIVAAGGGTAAAADLPNAQAVGRLVDGSVGGNPIQAIADVQDARATAPGDTSVQNPLDVKLLNAIDLPLTNLIKLPTNPAVQAGVANQVARANLNGASRGAAGAVANNGGALLGDDVQSQGFATLNLSGAALSGGKVTIPGLPSIPGLPTSLPGGGSLAALGGVTASIGAVTSTVGTEKGGDVIRPKSSVASVNLNIGSPALGALLSQLKGLLSSGALSGVLGSVSGLGAVLGGLTGGDASKCAFTSTTVPNLTLAGGGVTLDVDDATITVNVAKLLKTLLDKDLTDLDTSNFDLISFVVKNLPKILSTGLADLVTSITDPLETAFKNCVAVLPEPVKTLVSTVLGLVDQGKTTVLGAVNAIASQFAASSSGPLGTLADGLKNIVDVGLNVQSGPGIQQRDGDYPYESNLEATPNQSTPVVENQTLVRAVEINLLNVDAVPGGLDLGSLTGALGGNSAKVTKLTGAVRPLALAPGDGVVNLALANAAAGPSTAADEPTTTPSSSAPPTVVPASNIPTGIPAGQAGGADNGGLPVLPLVALLTLLAVSGGAFYQFRMRGQHLS